jgi:hypothetical protein
MSPHDPRAAATDEGKLLISKWCPLSLVKHRAHFYGSQPVPFGNWFSRKVTS